MSRSREQCAKRRSSSENMRKVSVYSTLKITRLYDYITHHRHIFKETHEVRKGLWAFFSWLCFWDADWLSKQTLITWQQRGPGVKRNVFSFCKDSLVCQPRTERQFWRASKNRLSKLKVSMVRNVGNACSSPQILKWRALKTKWHRIDWCLIVFYYH